MGGGSVFCYLCKKKNAYFFGTCFITQKKKQATALGAAFLAGIGSGVYDNLEETTQYVQIDKVYEPDMDNHRKYLEIFNDWQVLYKELLNISDKGLTDYMWIAPGSE